MTPVESVFVWGFFALGALFVGTLWIIQGRMLRRERAREEELVRLRMRVETVARIARSPSVPSEPSSVEG